MLRFHCPSCGEEKPPLWMVVDGPGDGSGLLFEGTHEPCLECSECGAKWRVKLYEIEEE